MTRWEACLLDSYACRTEEDDWNTQKRRQPVSPAFVNIWYVKEGGEDCMLTLKMAIFCTPVFVFPAFKVSPAMGLGAMAFSFFLF
jgi:hypothetical protein